MSFKTQFKIEFWPPVNGGQLELEETPVIVTGQFHWFPDTIALYRVSQKERCVVLPSPKKG